MTKNRRLANEIRDWLLDHDMWVDTVIYFDGVAYAPWDEDMKHFYYNDPTHSIEYEADPARCLEYYNRDTVTMTFEGPLYLVVNDYEEPRLKDEFDAIFKKHGFYYEQGYAWSLSCYQI